MLTLDQVKQRDASCARCGGHFRIVLPDREHWPTLTKLLPSNPMAFLSALRAQTGCSLSDAKGTMLHIAVRPGVCHRCAKPMPAFDVVADC